MIEGTETVKVFRKSSSSFDEYGNAIVTETQINFQHVLVGLAGGDEPVEVDSKPQVGKATLYFQPGAVIRADDEFEFHGQRWVKDGRVQDWVSPFVGLETGPVVIVRQQLG